MLDTFLSEEKNKEESVDRKTRKKNFLFKLYRYKYYFGVCSSGKLCLVLDLDHTLLHSVMFSELEAPVKKWLQARAEAEAALPAEQRMLFSANNIEVLY